MLNNYTPEARPRRIWPWLLAAGLILASAAAGLGYALQDTNAPAAPVVVAAAPLTITAAAAPLAALPAGASLACRRALDQGEAMMLEWAKIERDTTDSVGRVLKYGATDDDVQAMQSVNDRIGTITHTELPAYQASRTQCLAGN